MVEELQVKELDGLSASVSVPFPFPPIHQTTCHTQAQDWERYAAFIGPFLPGLLLVRASVHTTHPSPHPPIYTIQTYIHQGLAILGFLVGQHMGTQARIGCLGAALMGWRDFSAKRVGLTHACMPCTNATRPSNLFLPPNPTKTPFTSTPLHPLSINPDPSMRVNPNP